MRINTFIDAFNNLLSTHEFKIQNYLDSLTEVFVYGTGSSGYATFQFLTKNYPRLTIKNFIDSNSNKSGTYFQGIKIVIPDEVESSDKILIASDWAIEIAKKLKNKKCEATYLGFCEDFNRWKGHFDSKVFSQSYEEIIETAKLFSDDLSRRVFYSLIAFRCTLDPNHLLISDYEQYFHPKVLPSSNDIIIDGGAYDGDSAKQFFKYLSKKCKILCFECDQANYAKLVKLQKNTVNKIIPICKALWSENTILHFSQGTHDTESMISLKKNIKTYSIEAISLDCFMEDEPIGFLKLDIEGSEIQAIEGAKSIIQKQSPKLAISAYHLPDDLWRIPQNIFTINPKYNLYLGHHTQKFMDSVCYANINLM